MGKKKARAASVLVVDLGVDARDEDVVEQMRVMKRCREQNSYEHVVCTLRGFDDDPRETYEIPAVRAFCQRLMGLGFPSYLDGTTAPEAGAGPRLPGYGAMEVWLCAEGRLRRGVPLTAQLIRDFERMLGDMNTRADALLGPIAEG